MRRIPMTMHDWEVRLRGFLKLWDREVLQDAGKVTAEIAKAHPEREFEKYRIVQDRLFQSDFDRLIKQIDVVKLGSLGHDEFILSVSLQPRQSIAGGCLRRPGRGLS